MFEIEKYKSSKNTSQTLSIFLLAGVLFFIVIYSNSFAGEKIDTVYYQKGDRITGEVKSLDNNLLKLSTDDSGTIFKPVTRFSHCLYKIRTGRIFFDLVPQRIHTSVHTPSCNNNIITPDKIKNLVACKHPVRMSYEQR